MLIDFVATLARLLTRHGNRVGAHVLRRPASSGRSRPRSGRIQVLRLINDLLDQPRLPSAPFTDLAPLLDARPQRDQAPLAGLRRLRLHQRARLGAAARACSTGATRCSPSGSSTRARSTLPDVGPMIMEDAETGEQLYVDTRDAGFRRRFAAAAAAREAAIDRRVPAGRRRAVDALDRRGPRAARSSGWRRCAAPAAGRGMTFIWPACSSRSRSSRSASLAVRGAIDAPAGGGARVGGGSALGHRPRRGRRAATGAAPRTAADPGGPGRRRLRPARVALARPQATSRCRASEGTVILAFDVSGSMAADDVEPTRMEAAKAAARDVRRAPAAGRRHRGRRLQRRGHRRPGADERPGGGPRRDRAPDAAARARRSGRASSPRSSAIAIAAERHRRRLLHATARPSRPRRPTPVAAGHARLAPSSSCSPTARTTSGPTRSRPPRSPPTAASGSTRSGSAAPRARPSTSTASRSRPSSTRRRSSRSPTRPAGLLRAPTTTRGLAHGLRPARHARSSSSPRRSSSPRCVAGARRLAARWLAGVLARRSPGSGRLP